MTNTRNSRNVGFPQWNSQASYESIRLSPVECTSFLLCSWSSDRLQEGSSRPAGWTSFQHRRSGRNSRGLPSGASWWHLSGSLPILSFTLYFFSRLFPTSHQVCSRLFFTAFDSGKKYLISLSHRLWWCKDQEEEKQIFKIWVSRRRSLGVCAFSPTDSNDGASLENTALLMPWPLVCSWINWMLIK